MMAMSREMERAGLIEEMMDDVFEDEEESEEGEELLDAIMDEILAGVKTAPTVNSTLEAETTGQEADLGDMKSRLEQLKA